jgi:hypothetical protein
LCPPQIEDLSTSVEHTAVHATCCEWRDLARCDGNHGFVQQRNTPGDFSLPNQGAPLSLKRESHEVGVSKLFADFPGLNERVVGFAWLIPVYQAISDRKKEIPFLHTFGIALEESL